jgi:hypothetical protein
MQGERSRDPIHREALSAWPQATRSMPPGFFKQPLNSNTEMNFAAKERTDRKIRDLRAIPWRFIAHLPSESSDFFRFLTLCSLRSFAANHFPF